MYDFNMVSFYTVLKKPKFFQQTVQSDIVIRDNYIHE